MQLTEHFTLDEFTASETAARTGINNEPSDAVVENLRALCQSILEPLRRHLGRPVVITSGYRSAQLNRAVGGSFTSQHMTGKAADILVPGLSSLEVCRVIENLNLPFGQLINEFGRWTHVSLGSTLREKQLFTCHRVDGSTVYEKGLIDV